MLEENNFSTKNKLWKKIPSKISLWLVIIFVLVAFVFGVLMSGNVYWQKGKAIIKGANPNATSTFGVLENKDGQIPEYLTKDVDFHLFWEVWDLVKSKYYNKNIPETQLFYGALSGIVASLADPYSIFMTPQGTNEFQEEIEGNFEGIGAEIGMRNNQLTIISPLPDSPAFKAGLEPKDLVLAIDGKNTTNMSLDVAVSKIRGKKGTEVVLTIFRDGFSKSKDITIVREAINIPSLSWEFKDNSIAYIKARQFNDSTIPLFNDAIIDILKRRDIKGIILDLRYNPGGYLQSAIDLASEWVDGEVVVIEKFRDGSETKHQADREARLAGYKTVVLIDGGTASGSEIVAGALQDWGRATLVGEKTFGKGSVQELDKLKDGSSVKITIAKWFTPKGRSIDEEGIEPDVKVEMTDENSNSYQDPQLDKAMELIRNQ